ncbi:hypothetical protein V6R21_24590 [Limibacter armeniacum]|uniref:hypothetical protein n=1 Tax=Limibacter armeniacum TaxID=466084 RepID=UPI002FE65828
MKITKDTYNLFCKHGSELLWVSDPIREPRPKGTSEKTDEEFVVLANLDKCMELFHNDFYSQKMKMEYADRIESLKVKVTDEVFQLIENKYKK